MSRKRQSRTLGYGSLEKRCLLAADVGLSPVCADAPSSEEAIQADSITDSEDWNCAVTENGEDRQEAGLEQATETEDNILTESELTQDQNVSSNATADDATRVENRVEVFDLTDGSDGIFGSLTNDAPSQSMSLVAPADGQVEIVLAASMGDAETILEIKDTDGELVTRSTVDGLKGFHQIAFDVAEGESLELILTANQDGQPVEGEFQLTASFEADAPTDLHADEMGEDATVLDISEGQALISGQLETDADVDVFQFQANADGEVSVFSGEMTEGNEGELNVTVADAQGNELASGSTNEFMELQADVTEGETYFVAISSPEGQAGGEYNLAIRQILQPTVNEDVAPDLHADEIGCEATELKMDTGFALASGALESNEDRDAFRFVAPAAGETMLDLAALSENGSADLELTVFDEAGEVVTQGLSNQKLGVAFDAVEGNEYQVLIDATNDVPSNYFLSIVSRASFDVGSDALIEDDSTAPVTEASPESVVNSLASSEAEADEAVDQQLADWADSIDLRMDVFAMMDAADNTDTTETDLWFESVDSLDSLV